MRHPLPQLRLLAPQLPLLLALLALLNASGGGCQPPPPPPPPPAFSRAPVMSRPPSQPPSPPSPPLSERCERPAVLESELVGGSGGGCPRQLRDSAGGAFATVALPAAAGECTYRVALVEAVGDGGSALRAWHLKVKGLANRCADRHCAAQVPGTTCFYECQCAVALLVCLSQARLEHGEQQLTRANWFLRLLDCLCWRDRRSAFSAASPPGSTDAAAALPTIRPDDTVLLTVPAVGNSQLLLTLDTRGLGAVTAEVAVVLDRCGTGRVPLHLRHSRLDEEVGA
eukprot:365268-Chlamydomonas_euryale.AAC.14